MAGYGLWEIGREKKIALREKWSSALVTLLSDLKGPVEELTIRV